jgi:hypothetical protein
MKKRRYENPNSDNKNIDKNFLKETDNENKCNCYLCRELQDKKRIIQRQNSFLSNIVAFEQ